MHRTAVVAGCMALVAELALAAPGDGLVVTGDAVNVRAGPGTEYPVRLRVDRNQPAVELGRDREWVQVRLGDPAVQGWIHQSLLAVIWRAQAADAPARAVGPAARPDPSLSSEALIVFRSNVDELNARAQALAGVELFSGAEPAGSGVVRVLVTEAWHLVPKAGQESYSNVLFGHWRAVADGAEELRLQMVDPSGAVVIEKSGPANP